MIIHIAEYIFEGPYSSIEEVGERPGIFSITCVDKGKYYLLDVGHSNNVRAAIISHERSYLWQEYKRGEIMYAVMYAEGFSQEERQSVEEVIRNTYRNIPCKPS
jgi:hypothetical protein